MRICWNSSIQTLRMALIAGAVALCFNNGADAWTLSFPEEASVGVVVDLDQPLADYVKDDKDWWYHRRVEDLWGHVSEARGLVQSGPAERLGLDISPEGAAHLARMEPVPPGAFTTIRLRVPEEESADGYLRHLARLSPDADTLILEATRISADGLAVLPQFTKLRRLVVVEREISDTGLAHIAKATSLEGLYLDCGKLLTRSGVDSIAELGRLKQLMLSANVYEDGTLEALARLPKLWRLVLWHAPGGDFAHLPKMLALRDLSLMGEEYTPEELRHVGEITGLERLWINERISDEGVRMLSSLSNLKAIFLKRQISDSGRMTLTDETLEYLSGMSKLEEIELGYDAQYTDAGLVHLLNLAKLRVFAVNNYYPGSPGFSMDMLRRLAQLEHLEDVRICGVQGGREWYFMDDILELRKEGRPVGAQSQRGE